MNPHSPPTRTGLNLKSFQSWHWIFLAAILLAAIAISTFYFSSAQAQTADGTITGLTLTSDSPGTLTVSWEAANPTPTDYRVDWAKSPESYQSWKVDEGHVYPVATATAPPSPASNTTPSTKFDFVLATTEANTKASHGADHGQKPPSRWPESRRRRPPLNLHPIPHLQREPSTPLPPPTMTPANSYSPGQLPRLQTPRPRITT